MRQNNMNAILYNRGRGRAVSDSDGERDEDALR